MLCPHCQQEHPEASRYCPKTGAPLEWAMPVCPSCGKEVHPGARYCAVCGQALPREIHRPPQVQRAPAADPAAVLAGADAQPAAEPAGEHRDAAGSSHTLPTRPTAPPASTPGTKKPAPAKPPEHYRQSGPGTPPRARNVPALAWTAAPTEPQGRTARERRAQQKQWLGYLVVGIALVVALIGMATFLRPRGMGAQSSINSLLSASATAAGLAGPEQPSPSPANTLAAALQSPSPAASPTGAQPTKGSAGGGPIALQSATPVAAATRPPAATATAAPAAPNYRLAFFSNRDNLAVIYLMDPDHPQKWQVVPLPEAYDQAAWPSFCGDRLAFEARDRSLGLPLWIFLYNIEQETLERLDTASDPPERLMRPSCSPSGRWMALSSFRHSDWFLGLLDTGTRQILSERPAGEYANVGFAAWPQSEDRFVWMGTRASGYFDINETRIIDDQELSSNRLVAQGKYPAISPDGKRMASFCGNLLYLCMVERATNKMLFQIPVSYFKQVDRKEAPASAAWSSDGEWVYFSSSTSGNWDIYRMHPDGSMLQNLTEDWPSDELMPAAR